MFHRIRRRVFSLLCFASPVLAAAAIGCDSTKEVEPRLSRKGEVCQTTNDCVSGLSCMPRAGAGSGGICVRGEFKVAQSAKECAVIQCAEAKDCCPTPPSNCASLDQACRAGDTLSCEDFNRLCKCDTTKVACDQGSCRSICKTSTDCVSGTCVSGKCVQCQDDGDCRNGTVCSQNQCVAPCQTDSECPAFNRCAAGKCVDEGCSSDRECVAATRNVEALCKDSKCVVPCQTDLECGNPQDYRFYSCIQNQCVYVGCESDKECQLYLGQGVTPGPRTEIVCRDKVVVEE